MEDPRHRRLRRLNEESDQFHNLRQILNIIFMLGAVIGLIVFFTGNQVTATIIILAAMVFKIAECAFRFFK